MVDQYIKEILIEHGKVFVPRLGLIYKDIETNGNPFDPNVLKKPVYIYKINEEYYNEEDTWLVYAVARGNHSTIDDADVLIKQRVDEIKWFLGEGGNVKIDGIGTLATSYGKIVIADSSIAEESDDFFGIPSQIELSDDDSKYQDKNEEVIETYPSEPVIEHYSTPEPEYTPSPFVEEERVVPHSEEKAEYFNDDPYPYEEKTKSSKTGLIAIIAIVLLLGLGATYFFFLRPSSDSEHIEPVVNTEEPEEYDSTQVANASVEIPEAVPLSVKEEGKRYYIIVGSFTINENAQKLKRRLDSRGLKAKILESPDDLGIFRVSLADYEEFQEALTKTESFKKKHGNSLWILKY